MSAPKLVSATFTPGLYGTTPGQVQAQFDQNVDATDATTLANYSIPGMIITQASYNSSTFIASLTVQRAPDANTVALWAFDEPTAGSNLVDWSASATNLTQNASPGVGTGQINGDRTFNGTTQYFGPNAPPDSVRTGLAGNLTVEGWVNLTATVNPFWDFVSLCNPGTANGAILRVGASISTKQFYLSWETGTPGGGVFATANSGTSAVLTTGIWQHYACRRTFDGVSAYNVDFFIGGIQLSTVTGLAAPSGGQVGSVWLIGKDEAAANNFMDGAMDQTRVSKISRTNEEIQRSAAAIGQFPPFGQSWIMTVSNIRDSGHTGTIGSPTNTAAFNSGTDAQTFAPQGTNFSQLPHIPSTWNTASVTFTAVAGYDGRILPYQHGTRHNRGRN